MTPGLSAAFFESAAGAQVHRLPLEVFPSFWAYVYVIQKDEYTVLIDTGSGMDTSHQHLLDGLHKAGLQPADLTHILLTHAHIDHYGGLSRLRPLTQAKIGVHELDVQTISHHESRLALISRRLAAFLGETGLAEEKREQLLNIYRFTKAIYQSVSLDFTFEAIDMRLGPLEFIHLPGHCPGHVAIRLDDLIFCGDMVVQGVTPHLSPEAIHPYSGLDHYLDSLAHLQEWSKDARIVLNGHDDGITDLSGIIETTKENILRRVGKGIQALGEPCTLEAVCNAIYGESDGYNLLLMIEKTGAYMEYLYEHGMVRIINPAELEKGNPACYQRVREEAAMLAELRRMIHKHTVTPLRP